MGVRWILLSAALFTSPLVASSSPGPSVLLENVPHILQKPDFCGEACAAMWMTRLGFDVGQDHVFHASGLDPVLGRGCRTGELAPALARMGFRTGPVWHGIPGGDPSALDALFNAMLEDLRQGVPSIVCMRTEPGPSASEHFRLVLGYDAIRDHVIYHEPARKAGRYQRMGRKAFLGLWPLAIHPGSRTVIRIRLEAPAASLAVAPAGPGRTAAECCQRVMQTRIPRGFHKTWVPPFLVLGDGNDRERRAETVAWAVKRLKAGYFAADPPEVITVWLFKDKASYESHTWRLFKEKPTTPFGYYSPSERALVMNIATGGGTLVHEIVHPFMHANFAACPPWFNEGLASLYEACGDRDGRIVGRLNWRLPGLQAGVKAGRLPSFAVLMGMSEDAFYGADRYDVHYAQARYLCYYLQERGLLETYYRRFSGGHAQDPSGLKSLMDLLGITDMAVFQKAWEAWVLELPPPG